MGISLFIRIRTLSKCIQEKKHLDVYEEVTILSNEGSIRRRDIILLHRKINSGLIILIQPLGFKIAKIQQNYLTKKNVKYIMEE